MNNLRPTAEINFINRYTIKDEINFVNPSLTFRFLSLCIVSIASALTSAVILGMFLKGWLILLGAGMGALVGIAFMSSCWISGSETGTGN